MELKELISKLENYNKHYRTGESIVSDKEYDLLVEQLEQIEPTHPFLLKIGHNVLNDTRKQPLPVKMGSLNKISNIDEFHSWLKSKNIDINERFVLTPKYDGLSLLVNENNKDCWTRGDGEIGQYIPEHYNCVEGNSNMNFYSVGELLMNKNNFKKYKGKREDGLFSNSRNMVSGKITDKIPDNNILSECDFIRFGLSRYEFTLNKQEQLKLLNSINKVKVPYLVVKGSNIKEELFYDLFYKWNHEYEIDGIVIEVNDWELRKQLGNETNKNNPCFSRAFKGKFEEIGETEVIKVNWEISKQGFLKPTVSLVPIELDGVMVSNPTGYNAKFINENKIGPGSFLKIIRSGMVIPKIIGVIKQSDNFQLPTNCPSCNSELQWNENKVELMCINPDCESQQLKRIISFFKILEVDNVSEGTSEDFFNRGYTTIKDILYLKQEEMETWPGWGLRSAEIVYNSIHSKLQNIPIEKLQHASSIFFGLGSRKLKELRHLNDIKPSLEQIVEIKGFEEKSALVFINGFDRFNEWIKELPITIENNKLTEVLTNNKSIKMTTSNKLEGKSFVFTGFRSEEYQNKIEELSGKVLSSVSKNTSFLVMKEKNTGTIKENKAIKLGITILTREELEEMIFVE